MRNTKKAIYFYLLLFIVVVLPANTLSQEYKYEVGAATGTSFYMGDANKTKLYLHSGISGGALFRYKINFNWALKANIISCYVSVYSEDSGNVFPFDRNINFSRTFTDIGTQVEFNFLPYSDNYSYLGTKP